MSNSKISALSSATTPLTGSEIVPVNQSGVTNSVSVANLTAGRAVNASSYSATGNGYFYGATALAGTAEIGLGGSSVSNSYINVQSSGNSQLRLYTGGTYRGGMYSVGTGVVILNNGNVGQNVNVSVDGGGTNAWTFNTSSNLSPNVAGAGINFTANTPASGYTSQLLNWYEEGIWVTGMTADSGTIALAYDKLNYTRVGRMVSISGQITVNSISSPTGDIYISLPFTASASTLGRSGIWSSYLGAAYNFNGTPGGPMVGLFNGGATKMTIRVGNNAGGATASGYLTTNTTFDFGFTYQCQ